MLTAASAGPERTSARRSTAAAGVEDERRKCGIGSAQSFARAARKGSECRLL